MRRSRGQSTVELALILPFLVGLFTLALQGGQLISDQINLTQAAADGAEWAAINVTTQGDTAIRTHVMDQLCGAGGSPSTPASGATKYCNATLTVTVSARTAPTSQGPAAAPGPRATGAVLGAKTGCKSWNISVTPVAGNPSPVTQSTTLQYLVQLNVQNGGGNLLDPIVSLSGNGFPNNTFPGSPTFNPPSVSSAGSASTLNITTTQGTTPGTYTVSVSGLDQCNNGPAAGNVQFTITVNGTGPPSPSPCTPPSILSVVPITAQNGSITGVTILGSGFGSGSTVSFGGSAASLVTIVSATQITAVLPAGGLSPGVYTMTVSAPSGQCLVSSNNSLTICSGPCPTPGLGGGGGGGSTQNPCATSALPNHYQTVIAIAWQEPLFVPWFNSAVTLNATQYLYCQ
ncbi:MAG TPA: TadE/TadG family type IV pilus assembly protein [Candidatus Dormibacteraeota bacterium]|jgi:Flp pilus assembly protein TadG|nr:TadE/TadG family type IV pilus assembly protein [Candidatus Dormibacteraeota bacterium]